MRTPGESKLCGLILVGFVGALGVAGLHALGVQHKPLLLGLLAVFSLLGVGSVLALVVASSRRRTDVEPDFLRLIAGSYFERDGFAFVLAAAADQGIYYVRIVYQNQYEHACYARVSIQAPVKTLRIGAREFDGVRVDLQCEGGAVGEAFVPMAIPKRFQGRGVRFDVGAAVRYRDGQGQPLRFQTGMPVGKADDSGLGTSAATAAFLAMGVIYMSRPARIVLPVPGNMAEVLPADAQVRLQTIWRRGDPVEQVAQHFAAGSRGAGTGPEPVPVGQ